MEISNFLTAITNNMLIVLGILGAFAFLVSVITEVTKNIRFMKKIPTDLQVIILSTVLCLVAYLAYTSYFTVEIQWYYIAGSLLAAFIVSFVAMYGWDKLTALYSRFKK